MQVQLFVDAHLMRFLVFVLALLCALPASFAQVDPVYQPPQRPASRTNQAVSMTRALFNSLVLVENPQAIGNTLSEMLRRSGKPCTAVTDFQVVHRQSTEQRIKVKCPGLPHYGMVISKGGALQVFGGDGMVGDFNVGNGIIHAATDTPRAAIDEETRKPNYGPNGNLPGLLQGDDPDHIPAWLVTLIIVNGFIVLALLLSFFWFMRAKTSPQRIAPDLKNERSSDEKDAMVIESREVLPDIFQHPGGLFIARGKRGKRRLFGSLFFAILYRDYGWKLREVE